jgi:hypothetical protein
MIALSPATKRCRSVTTTPCLTTLHPHTLATLTRCFGCSHCELASPSSLHPHCTSYLDTAARTARLTRAVTPSTSVSIPYGKAPDVTNTPSGGTQHGDTASPSPSQTGGAGGPAAITPPKPPRKRQPPSGQGPAPAPHHHLHHQHTQQSKLALSPEQLSFGVALIICVVGLGVAGAITKWRSGRARPRAGQTTRRTTNGGGFGSTASPA